MYNSLTRKQIYHCLVCDEGAGAKAEVMKTLEISIHVHRQNEHNCYDNGNVLQLVKYYKPQSREKFICCVTIAVQLHHLQMTEEYIHCTCHHLVHYLRPFQVILWFLVPGPLPACFWQFPDFQHIQ